MAFEAHVRPVIGRRGGRTCSPRRGWSRWRGRRPPSRTSHHGRLGDTASGHGTSAPLPGAASTGQGPAAVAEAARPDRGPATSPARSRLRRIGLSARRGRRQGCGCRGARRRRATPPRPTGSSSFALRCSARLVRRAWTAQAEALLGLRLEPQRLKRRHRVAAVLASRATPPSRSGRAVDAVRRRGRSQRRPRAAPLSQTVTTVCRSGARARMSHHPVGDVAAPGDVAVVALVLLADVDHLDRVVGQKALQLVELDRLHPLGRGRRGHEAGEVEEARPRAGPWRRRPPPPVTRRRSTTGCSASSRNPAFVPNEGPDTGTLSAP